MKTWYSLRTGILLAVRLDRSFVLIFHNIMNTVEHTFGELEIQVFGIILESFLECMHAAFNFFYRSISLSSIQLRSTKSARTIEINIIHYYCSESRRR